MKILKRFSYTPRWIIFLLDVFLSFFSIALACILTSDFQSGILFDTRILAIIGVVMSVRVITFIMGQTYSEIIRYTGAEDVYRLFTVLSLGEIVLIGVNVCYFLFMREFFMPWKVLVMEYVILLCAMTVMRLVVKMTFAQHFATKKVKKNIIVCGIDEYGIMAKHALDNAEDVSYNILAFIDMNDKATGKYLEGVEIHNSASLPALLNRYKVDKVLFALRSFSPEKKSQLFEACLTSNVEILEVPHFESWINGELNMKQIRNIKIEDLLERGVIELDDVALRKQLLNRTVLVTGAAGSIGSEIVRQLTKFRPNRIVLVDIAESPLYDLQLELSEKLHFTNFTIEMGDVRDLERMENIFEIYQPQMVYHAAAYKHVPMVELLPLEGIKTNIVGTKNIADLSVKYKCDRFVMVSTDKAINPTNVMGCTKRIAEIYTQSLDKNTKTAFITTRFGNVLGSNGSVIPRFKRQIQSGGPVTVTHPDITRYFMTIAEACQLVLQAGALGQGGEIFVFDMGKSMKIADLAKKMIKQSGFEVGKDIQIVYTGLRPGEKLFEEVLNVEETTLPTPHKRIMRARVREYDFEVIKKETEELMNYVRYGSTFDAIRKMKIIVPEFKSNNSVYEEIDFQLEASRRRRNIPVGVLDN